VFEILKYLDSREYKERPIYIWLYPL